MAYTRGISEQKILDEAYLKAARECIEAEKEKEKIFSVVGSVWSRQGQRWKEVSRLKFGAVA